MKKVSIITLCVLCAAFFASCNKISYNNFVGTWGVEKIEYYNIDYAGNPIPATMQTYTYNPDDIGHGIQLVFFEDQNGEMRDNDVDSVQVVQGNDTVYVYCPDTTIVTKFVCSFDKRSSTLYMTTEKDPRPYSLDIHNMTNNSFIYESEYWGDYVERAYLKRLSNSTSKETASRSQSSTRPNKPGAFLRRR